MFSPTSTIRLRTLKMLKNHLRRKTSILFMTSITMATKQMKMRVSMTTTTVI